jgi:hypothetical protein
MSWRRGWIWESWGVALYVGKSISKLQMDIELQQTRVLIWKILLFLNIISLYIGALVPSFHKPLKTSSIKFEVLYASVTYLLTYARTFLNFVLEGGLWSASCSCCYTPGERASSTCLVGGWVGPRDGLDAVEERNICSCQESNPNSMLSRLWSICYTEPYEIGTFQLQVRYMAELTLPLWLHKQNNIELHSRGFFCDLLPVVK